MYENGVERAAERTPPAPNTTDSDARGSASIACVTSQDDMTSAGVAAVVAPSATSGAHFEAVRFHTQTSTFCLRRSDAICLPMMPRPRKPTRGAMCRRFRLRTISLFEIYREAVFDLLGGPEGSVEKIPCLEDGHGAYLFELILFILFL